MRLLHHKSDQSTKNIRQQRIDAQPWDIAQYAQYAIQKKHDGQVRCTVFFRSSLDLERIKRAILQSLNALPQLQSRYIPDEKQPYWQIHMANIDELFSTVTTNCTDDEVVAFLPVCTDSFRGPQIRFKLVRGQARDTLCVVVNRMICDEAGLKEYLYLLSQVYTDIHSPFFQSPQPEKLYIQRVLQALPPMARLKAQMHQQVPLEMPSVQAAFPLSGKEDVPFIVTHTLPVSRYQSLARYAVYRHVQVEEILLTAYIRAIHAMLHDKSKGLFPIACQKDLRRFLPWGSDHVICGLSLPNLFVAPAKLPGDFNQTLTVVRERLSKLGKLAAVIENAKALGLFPFSSKRAQEHLLSANLPHYLFNYIGKVDGSRLMFGEVDINDVYITGPIYNQPDICLCATVYEDSLTFSCNLAGTRDDWATCKYFLALLVRELPAET